MPTRISWNLNVQIPQGPNLTIPGQLDVDAYDKVNVTVGAGANDRPVELQPGGAGQVRVLLVRSSLYGDNLTYKVNDAANPPHALNDCLLLVGRGSVELLGFPPNNFLFTNGLAQDVTIEILIGRQAM